MTLTLPDDGLFEGRMTSRGRPSKQFYHLEYHEKMESARSKREIKESGDRFVYKWGGRRMSIPDEDMFSILSNLMVVANVPFFYREVVESNGASREDSTLKVHMNMSGVIGEEGITRGMTVRRKESELYFLATREVDVHAVQSFDENLTGSLKTEKPSSIDHVRAFMDTYRELQVSDRYVNAVGVEKLTDEEMAAKSLELKVVEELFRRVYKEENGKEILKVFGEGPQVYEFFSCFESAPEEGLYHIIVVDPETDRKMVFKNTPEQAYGRGDSLANNLDL